MKVKVLVFKATLQSIPAYFDLPEIIVALIKKFKAQAL
jgi:hypothetical protein